MSKFELDNKTIYRIGNSDDDLLNFYIEFYKDILRKNNIPLTREVLDYVKQQASDDHLRRTKMIFDQGIPDYLKTVFNLNSKAEIEKHFKSITITQNDLFLLIHNHAQIGLSYESFFKEFIPEHLEPSDSDIKNFAKEPQKNLHLIKKFSELLKQRKRIHVHNFTINDKWYCFFFDYNDIGTSQAGNHWVEGNHIHFVSSHWGKHLDNILDSFQNRTVKLPKLHIKFELEES